MKLNLNKILEDLRRRLSCFHTFSCLKNELVDLFSDFDAILGKS